MAKKGIFFMNIVNVSLEQIHPYENNAKKHDQKQINNVAESIRQFGFVQPLVIDKDGIIIIGHCRYAASLQLGLREVPCVIADLGDEQTRKLRLLDNKLNESEWDLDAILLEIDNGVDNLDFSDFDIDWELPEENEKEENKINNVALEIYNKAKEYNDIETLCYWIKDTYLSDLDI